MGLESFIMYGLGLNSTSILSLESREYPLPASLPPSETRIGLQIQKLVSSRRLYATKPTKAFYFLLLSYMNQSNFSLLFLGFSDFSGSNQTEWEVRTLISNFILFIIG